METNCHLSILNFEEDTEACFSLNILQILVIFKVPFFWSELEKDCYGIFLIFYCYGSEKYVFQLVCSRSAAMGLYHM